MVFAGSETNPFVTFDASRFFRLSAHSLAARGFTTWWKTPLLLAGLQAIRKTNQLLTLRTP